MCYCSRYGVSLMHLLRGNMGTGIFAMGDAFKNGGMVIAPLGMALIFFISLHLQHVLVNILVSL